MKLGNYQRLGPGVLRSPGPQLQQVCDALLGYKCDGYGQAALLWLEVSGIPSRWAASLAISSGSCVPAASASITCARQSRSQGHCDRPDGDCAGQTWRRGSAARSPPAWFCRPASSPYVSSGAIYYRNCVHGGKTRGGGQITLSRLFTV